jgi:hypothetical protein
MVAKEPDELAARQVKETQRIDTRAIEAFCLDTPRLHTVRRDEECTERTLGKQNDDSVADYV